MRKKQGKSLSWARSRWFLGITLTLFFLLSISLSKELYRSYQINQEINKLQADIIGLESKNQEIADFVEYLKTDRYFEEQARLKFGLKSPGEKVLVLQDDSSAGVAIPGFSAAAGQNQVQEINNPQKWFQYFFGG